MKKILPLFIVIVLTSCVSKQKYATLENENIKLKTEINNLEHKVIGLDNQNMEYLQQLEDCSKKNK